MKTSENIIRNLGSAAASFEAEVIKSRKPVLVAFGAPWSRPCQILNPILQELAREWAGKVKVVNVNADDSLDLSLRYDIQSIPTLLYLVKGKLRVQIVGTATKDAIIAKLKTSGFADPNVVPRKKASVLKRQIRKES